MNNIEIIFGFMVALQIASLAIIYLRLRTLSRHLSAKKTKSEASTNTTIEVEKQSIERIQQQTEKLFTQVVQDASQKFHGDLEETSKRLNALIVRITTDVVERELEEYREGLSQARTEAINSMQQMQQAVEQHQKALEADVDTEVAKRRAYLIERLDQHLSQAVSMYLVEALGKGADLGAQRGFILQSLEGRKADLKKEMNDEV